MNITFLIISLVSMVFAFCFLMAALFTFATNDEKPLDRETEQALNLFTWLGGGVFVYVFIIKRNWRQCRLGRRCFYVGLAFAAVALSLNDVAMRW